jgi:ferrous iron transport protein A
LILRNRFAGLPRGGPARRSADAILQTIIIVILVAVVSNLLSALAPQTPALVESLDVEFAVRERLHALGLRVGREIRVVRRLGRHGPLQIRVDHTDVILRGAEAARITVAPLAAKG